MGRILPLITKAGIKCLPCDRLSLDIERFMEYKDSDDHPAEMPFERNASAYRKCKVDAFEGKNISTILKYFLDGSRRTYKVADVILDGRYLPLIAGQVGVAVVERTDFDGSFLPLKGFCSYRTVIAFPDRISNEDVAHLEERINREGRVQFKLLRYTVKKDHDPIDLGIAKIMSEMHDLEVKTVQDMATQGLIRNDELLVIDGPLRFKKKFDLVQFRNVIGLSKTFKPSFVVGKGKRREDVGSIASGLDFGERSIVFKTAEEDKTIGMWYIRLRPPRMMTDPLQGVVKAECYAIELEDIENGFDPERINIISSHLLRERNVTPYKADFRWASHIYPIFLAETYLKKTFMSDIHFKAYF